MEKILNITWLRPFPRNDIGGNVCFGLDPVGNWWVLFESAAGARGVPERIAAKSPALIGLWPLMFDRKGFGGDYLHVHHELAERLVEAGFNGSEASRFPYREIAVDAIRRHSGWAHGGYDWIADFSLDDIDVELANLLFSGSRDANLPQRLRHKVAACVHRWEKKNHYSFIRQ